MPVDENSLCYFTTWWLACISEKVTRTPLYEYFTQQCSFAVTKWLTVQLFVACYFHYIFPCGTLSWIRHASLPVLTSQLCTNGRRMESQPHVADNRPRLQLIVSFPILSDNFIDSARHQSFLLSKKAGRLLHGIAWVQWMQAEANFRGEKRIQDHQFTRMVSDISHWLTVLINENEGRVDNLQCFSWFQSCEDFQLLNLCCWWTVIPLIQCLFIQTEQILAFVLLWFALIF